MLRFSFSIIVICLRTQSVAQQKIDSVWIQSPDGCKVYNPNPIKNETISWSGDCLNGYANGTGELIWLKNGKPNQQYIGILKRGVPQGDGEYNYLDGHIDKGQYSKGELEGLGQTTYRGKKNNITYSYQGEFKKGKPNGTGIEVYFYDNSDTSSVYHGFFEDDHRTGLGVLKEFEYKKFSIRKGLFEHDKYKGVFEIWKFVDGKEVSYYKGHVGESGSYEGNGEETAGLHKYDGQWKNGRLEGYGKMYYSNIIIYEGDWKNGKFDGNGRRLLPDGSHYAGEFKNNERAGFGVLKLKNGFIYIGEFRKNLFHGLGYWLNLDKVSFAGYWSEGKLITPSTFQLVKNALAMKHGDLFQKLVTSN